MAVRGPRFRSFVDEVVCLPHRRIVAVPSNPVADLISELQREPQLYSAPLHYQNRGKRLVLIRHVKRATEAGSAQRWRDGSPCICCRVAVLAQMRQHNGAKSRVMELSQQLRGGSIGEVAGRSGNPSLYNGRVVTGA